MKKSLIALSVLAGMFGVAQAENTTTLYGAIGYSVKVADKSENNRPLELSKTTWDLNRSVARFGIRGTEDLNGGLQAFYRFEFNVTDAGVTAKEGTRYAYLGLKGDFGTLTLGRQKSIFATATDFNDNFQDTYFKYHHGPNRLSKVISYVSPDIYGFKIGASMILDGDNSVITTSDSKGIDAWEAGAFYENSGEHESSEDSYYNLAGEYYLGNNTFRAGFGYDDGKGKNDWYEYALGYQYNLSPRTYTWVEGSYYDPRQKGAEDNYEVVVGVRHDF